ncbi:MAG: GTPase [Clostridia bacterium]|nr:GTPase [Clostridia bacterium]
MEIPVFLFTGFLDSGKTTFIQSTLEDKRFNNGTSTLVLLCEDGEEEYDEEKFASKNCIHIEEIESLEDLSEEKLAALQKKHKAKRVVVECNGMWQLDSFLEAMPEGWLIYQEMSFADATTYLTYNANMRNLVGDKLKNCDMIVFNRFTEALNEKKEDFHKIVRSVSRRANIVFDYGDHAEPDDIVDPLPFDIEADVIEIGDNDYGIWYADLTEDRDKYAGKTVKFTGIVATNGKMPPNSFIIGRHIMTCCADDVMFGGLACKWTGVNALTHLAWIKATAKITIEKHKLYGNEAGPVLNILKVEKGEKPDPEVVTFI